MNSVDKATEAQLHNLQTRSGKTLDQLFALMRKSGLKKHGELRDLLKRDLGMGHGDANALAGFYLQSSEAGAPGSPAPRSGDVLDQIYAGPKAELRPIHDRLMTAIDKLGAFEIAPKKGYVSLRRKKQFAMIGPASKGRLELGLNMKGAKPTSRLLALPAGGMCQYKIYLTQPKEVDKELLGWIRQAYEAAA